MPTLLAEYRFVVLVAASSERQGKDCGSYQMGWFYR
jgi:hypothetical protein